MIEGVKVLRKIWEGVEVGGVSSGNFSNPRCTHLFGKLVFLSGTELVFKGRRQTRKEEDRRG